MLLTRMYSNIIKMESYNSIRWAFKVTAWNPTVPQFLLAASCIQEEEKSRIGRFVFKKDAKASLIGRLLLRKFVADFSGILYESVKFDRDCNGRPFLLSEEATNLNFNVSHQGDYVVLAGETRKLQLGIDVMKMEYKGGKELSEFFRLMNRQFSPQEWITIRGPSGTPDIDQLSMFIRHWCLKESYVKAIGVGITIDLQSISFKINTKNLLIGIVTCDTEIFVDGVYLEDWCFEETLLDDKHCVATAINEPKQQCTVQNRKLFECLEFDDLVKGSTPLFPFDSIYCENFFRKEEKPF